MFESVVKMYVFKYEMYILTIAYVHVDESAMYWLSW